MLVLFLLLMHACEGSMTCSRTSEYAFKGTVSGTREVADDAIHPVFSQLQCSKLCGRSCRCSGYSVREGDRNHLCMLTTDIHRLTTGVWDTYSAYSGEDQDTSQMTSALISGSENYIPDSALTAASSSTSLPALCGRIGVPKPAACLSNAWCPSSNSPTWIQADLGTEFMVTQVATQGRISNNQWVRTYKLAVYHSSTGALEYSLDSITGQAKIFNGNTDGATIVTNDLPLQMEGQVFRVYGVTMSGWPCMSVELHGFKRSSCCL